jgi:hypothetical protein
MRSHGGTLKQKKMTDFYGKKKPGRKTKSKGRSKSKSKSQSKTNTVSDSINNLKQKEITNYYSPRTAPTFNEVYRNRHLLDHYFQYSIEKIYEQNVRNCMAFDEDPTETLIVFWTTGTGDEWEDEDDYVEPFPDKRNTLDMNTPMTKKYLDSIWKKHVRRWEKTRYFDDFYSSHEEFDETIRWLPYALKDGIERRSVAILKKHIAPIQRLPNELQDIIFSFNP